MMSQIKKRIKGDTPKFFKNLIKVCIGIGAVGAVLVAAPVALPVALISAGGYMITIGAVGAAVSKLTVTDDSKKDQGIE